MTIVYHRPKSLTHITECVWRKSGTCCRWRKIGITWQVCYIVGKCLQPSWRHRQVQSCRRWPNRVRLSERHCHL